MVFLFLTNQISKNNVLNIIASMNVIPCRERYAKKTTAHTARKYRDVTVIGLPINRYIKRTINAITGTNRANANNTTKGDCSAGSVVLISTAKNAAQHSSR